MNPLLNIEIYLIHALLIAITAFVYSYILVQPGEFFSKLFLILDKFFETDKRAAEGLPPHPLFKMIMRCEKCVAGQMAFWIYLVYCLPYYLECQFDLIISHILFVGLSIFLTLITKNIYIKHIQ